MSLLFTCHANILLLLCESRGELGRKHVSFTIVFASGARSGLLDEVLAQIQPARCALSGLLIGATLLDLLTIDTDIIVAEGEATGGSLLFEQQG